MLRQFLRRYSTLKPPNGQQEVQVRLDAIQKQLDKVVQELENPSIQEPTPKPDVKSNQQDPSNPLHIPRKEWDPYLQKFHDDLKRHPKLQDNKFYQKLMDEREVLLHKAFDEGYWENAREIAQGGGKTRMATQGIYSVAQSPPMLPLQGPGLAKGSGTIDALQYLQQGQKLTLVCLMFSAFAEDHVKSFLNPFLEAYPNIDVGSKTRVLLVNVEEQKAKALILRAITPFVRRSTPANLQSSYMFQLSSIEDTRKNIGVSNRHFGYTYLVDSKARIRWAAMGKAEEDEVDRMLEACKLLLK